MKHSEFIWGIVIGCILTFLGAIIQQQLYERYETKKTDHQLSGSLCSALNSRYFLARNVLNNSGSSLFDDRWDEYIKQGYTPWNINKRLYRKFIERKHPDLSVQFNDAETHLEELHNMLIELRKKQGSNDPKLQKEIPDKIKNEFGIILSIVDEINIKLYDF